MDHQARREPVWHPVVPDYRVVDGRLGDNLRLVCELVHGDILGLVCRAVPDDKLEFVGRLAVWDILGLS